MSSIKTLALGLTLALAAPLAADSYTIDRAHSEVAFKTLHLGISKVPGTFTSYQEKIDINEKDATKSSLQIEIDASSVSTGQAKRDGHLNGPDFFDTAKYPKISFKSTKITKTKTGYDVTGDLSIRDVTKSVTLKGELSGPLEAMKGIKRGFSLEGSINRMDYGVAWGMKLPGGTLVVAEEVKLLISGELDKAAPAEAKK